jgi:inosine/xanthosine triphosphate pyrophosphatase family protein
LGNLHSMSPKSGHRFSEKIMLKQETKAKCERYFALSDDGRLCMTALIVMKRKPIEHDRA